MRGKKLEILQLIEARPCTLRELAAHLRISLNCAKQHLTQLRWLGVRIRAVPIHSGRTGRPQYRYELAEAPCASC